MRVVAVHTRRRRGPPSRCAVGASCQARGPLCGKYRIVDFTLSNCVNSGIFDIGVLTQYMPRSLNEHIGIGRSWDLDRSRGGISLLQPYQGGSTSSGMGGRRTPFCKISITFARAARTQS